MRVQCGDLECGMRPMSSGPRRRIVGGQSAGAGSWPWQAALYKEGDFQCGAVLISDTWLISAAHCFYSTQSAHWVARLGLLRRGTELSAPSEQVRRVVEIFLHPEYEDKGFINDIALLRMDKPVLFSDYLRPVCLPTAQEDAGLWHGHHCSVVGWGKLYEIGHTFPDSLQEVRLPVISTEECRKRILFLTMYHITDNMFCAGYERGGRDACLGDSGGPLMCQREDGRWLVLGVTSNGDGCGRPKRPGVYTKVANYLAWIKQVTEGEHAVPAIPDRCEGVRCRLGRCVAPYKVCDGRWDCSEGRDEDQCFGQE
ncbi:prostasin [Trichonephila inaurata madagascariensis]|uniref:Prostasin n=1 Tax=Trichonephila inaurata madagascariensis TaxID=2747483 RepID=A0A8X6WV90_9ARAC|nr:prostasin [Trichonephila inaurata madagascariensis]